MIREYPPSNNGLPTIMVMTTGETIIGLLSGNEGEFLLLDAAIQIQAGKEGQRFSPLLDPFSVTEMPPSSVKYMQVLYPDMGTRAIAFANYLAYRDILAAELKITDEYRRDILYPHYQEFIKEVEAKQGHRLTLSVADSAMYSHMLNCGKEAEAEAFLKEAEANFSKGVKKASVATCEGKVVTVDFRSRTIGKPEHLDSDGDT